VIEPFIDLSLLEIYYYIRIIGEKTSLEKAVGTTLTGKIPVSGLVRKWCRL
jgi:hypothetical protein